MNDINTLKRNIIFSIFLAYDDDIPKYRELTDLINKLNETQLKELDQELNISQVDVDQTIYDYMYENMPEVM